MAINGGTSLIYLLFVKCDFFVIFSGDLGEMRIAVFLLHLFFLSEELHRISCKFCIYFSSYNKRSSARAPRAC